MDARLVAIVTAMPVVAHALQLLGALITARFGHRRSTLACVALSRQAFLPLALGPLLPLGPEGRRWLLLGVAGTHHGLGILSNNGWNAWMGELVPGRIRGRYFGRRTAISTVVGGVSTLAVGVALDRTLGIGLPGAVLQGTALLACLAGAISVVLMARQHAEPARPVAVRHACRALAAPFRDRDARKVIAYGAAWNAACGLSVPFFGLFVLRDLHGGYALLAAEGAGLAAAKVASAPRWGRAVDRFGARPVLVACTAGLALSPLAWIACEPGRIWPLVGETLVGGVLLGGHSVASFDLPLSIAPRRERPFYLGAMAMAGGAAFGITAFAGSALVGRALGPGVAVLGASGGLSVRTLLVASSGLRLVALGTALALPGRKEREAAVAASSASGLVARMISAVRLGLPAVGGVDRPSTIDWDVFRSRWPANRVLRLVCRGGLLWTASGRTRLGFISITVPTTRDRPK
jgi:MFS family permease